MLFPQPELFPAEPPDLLGLKDLLFRSREDVEIMSFLSVAFSLRPLFPYLTPVSSPSHSRALCSPPCIVGTANRLFKVAFTSSWIAAESLWRPARPSCALPHFILLCLATSASPPSTIHPAPLPPSAYSFTYLSSSLICISLPLASDSDHRCSFLSYYAVRSKIETLWSSAVTALD